MSKTSIHELQDNEIEVLLKELEALDSKVHKKLQYVLDKTKCSLQEGTEYIVQNSPTLWAKVYLNWTARDYQITILDQGKKGKKIVLRLGRRLGKCLPGNTLIPDSITGEYVSVKELFKRQQANIYSISEDNNKVVNNATNIIFENGVKPVYRVTTRNGRIIEATGNHPLYTINGWREIDNLKIGDYVGIATNMKHSNPIKMDEEKIKFLAYILGDGNCSGMSLRFSCSQNNLKILTEFGRLCTYFECVMKKYEYNKSSDYNIVADLENNSYKNKDYNKARNFLKEQGMWGRNSHTKEIPSDIFKLSNEQLKIFISRLYGTDGWASLRKRGNGIEIGYCSVSKKLITQLQSLLLRFDINSTVRKKNVKYNGKINIAYTLEIVNAEEALRFCDEIGIYSKEEAVKKVRESAIKSTKVGRKVPNEVIDLVEYSMKKNNITKSQIRKDLGFKINKTYKTIFDTKLKKICDYIGDKELEKYYNNNIIWDEIVNIELIGDMPTYDLTVPEHHNFVANDFITHNTECMCILILWHAFTQINKGEEDKYNILIVTPYETQVDLIFDRLKQLIDNSSIFKGMVKRDVYHRIELTNGTVIKGMTAASRTGSGAANTRGQRADLLVIDEIDYMTSPDITNIVNIRNEAPDRIKLLVSSTPSGKHEEFWKWCTGASHKFFPKQEDMDNFKFTGFLESHEKGNGWIECYAPSIVNKELLKINPDTNQTYLEDLKDELSAIRFDQEVMANFGEEEMGVYQRRFLEAAVEEGKRINHKYTTEMSKEEFDTFIKKRRNGPRILGCDWDRKCIA